MHCCEGPVGNAYDITNAVGMAIATSQPEIIPQKADRTAVLAFMDDAARHGHYMTEEFAEGFLNHPEVTRGISYPAMTKEALERAKRAEKALGFPPGTAAAIRRFAMGVSRK